MIIKKQFSDIGSIVKSLLKVLNLQMVHIRLGFDPTFPGEITVKVIHNFELTLMAIITWHPGKVQYIDLADTICLPQAVKKKVVVKSGIRPLSIF